MSAKDTLRETVERFAGVNRAEIVPARVKTPEPPQISGYKFLLIAV